MSSTTLLPLHFASHLFALTVAMAAGFVLARRARGMPLERVAGAAGFSLVAASEALHGAGFATESSVASTSIRAAGYVLVLASALRPSPSLAGVGLIAPVHSVAPALAALLAGAALAWRAQRERGAVAIGSGLVLIGAGESFLAAAASGAEGAPFLAHLTRTLGWGLVAVGVMSATRRSIRFRYVASFVAVLLVVVLAVSSALTRVIGENVRREATSRVENETEALADRFVPKAVEAVDNATISTLGVAQTLRDQPGEADRLFNFLRRVLRVDFMIGVARAGDVIAFSGQLDEAEALEIAGSDATIQAARGVPSASLDALGANDLVVVGAARISDDPSQGVMVVGYRVNDGLLRLLGPATEAFVVRSGTVSASSLPGFAAGSPLPPDLAARIERETIARGESFGTFATLGGRDYLVRVRPLTRTDGLIVGALVGTESPELLAAAEQGVSRVLFLVTLGAVAVAIALSLLFGRRFTRPVRQLTAAARRVQAGDLTTKAPVAGEDEVGDLAIAFNRMTESLSSTTESLRRAVDQEARLRDQLETVLNSMGDGLVAVDVSGRVVTFNPAAERISGLSAARAIGRPVSEVLVGRTAHGRASAGRDNPSGLSYLRRKGGEVPVAISSAPIRDPAGELLGRVFVIRDRSREEEVERVKREFLATVSHELRTPLTPIVGYSELLVRRDFDQQRVEEFARGILSSARRMERIVGMLLDYSAIEAGRMPVEPESVHLRPLVVGAVDEWRERAPSHRFVTRFSPGAPPALVDAPLFRRTMDELLDNAVKYSPNGGTITVAVRPNGRRNGRGSVEVLVSDEGIGIPARQLPRIFQDFRQLDGSDTRTFGGLGLGLAFVKRIIQAHRGTITAESRPGRGTTFKIGLPAAESGQRGR